MSKKRPLEERKSRDAKRKRLRLQREGIMRKLSTAMKRTRRDLRLTILRRLREEDVIIGVAPGVFGHPRGVTLRITPEVIAGCNEDTKELAALVNNVGILALSALVAHDLAEGIDGLAKSLAKWAQVDLEALKRAAEAEAAENEPDSPKDPGDATPTEPPVTQADLSPGAEAVQ